MASCLWNPTLHGLQEELGEGVQSNFGVVPPKSQSREQDSPRNGVNRKRGRGSGCGWGKHRISSCCMRLCGQGANPGSGERVGPPARPPVSPPVWGWGKLLQRWNFLESPTMEAFKGAELFCQGEMLGRDRRKSGKTVLRNYKQSL